MFRRRDRGSRDEAGEALGKDLEVEDAPEAAAEIEGEAEDTADQPEDMDADLESQAADYLADNDVWLYGPHAKEVLEPRPVVVVRQFDQRKVFAQRNGLGTVERHWPRCRKTIRRRNRNRHGRPRAGIPGAGDLDRRWSLRWCEARLPRPPDGSLVKVRVTSISVFLGKALVRGK